MKVTIKADLIHSKLVADSLKYFNQNGGLKKKFDPKKAVEEFYSLKERELGGKVDDAEIIFGFPLIWVDDVQVNKVWLDPQHKLVYLYTNLNAFFQELKQVATTNYVEKGGGFTRNPNPPIEAYVYEDHSGNLSGDTKSIAYHILRAGPPYSSKGERILHKYGLK